MDSPCRRRRSAERRSARPGKSREGSDWSLRSAGLGGKRGLGSVGGRYSHHRLSALRPSEHYCNLRTEYSQVRCDMRLKASHSLRLAPGLEERLEQRPTGHRRSIECGEIDQPVPSKSSRQKAETAPTMSEQRPSRKASRAKTSTILSPVAVERSPAFPLPDPDLLENGPMCRIRPSPVRTSSRTPGRQTKQ